MEDKSFLESASASAMDMDSISNMVERLKAVDAKIEETEEELKRLKKIKEAISCEEIPNFLSNFGMSELKFEDGSKLTIKEEVFPSISKTDPIKQKQAYNWLSQNGAGHLIKNELVVGDFTKEVEDFLFKKGFSFKTKKEVNTQSLKAFFRDQLGINKNSKQKITVNDIPEFISCFMKKTTVIK